MSEQHLLIIPALDKDAADKITVTVDGPDTPDKRRVIRVLAHLFHQDSGEWDGPNPNVSVIATGG